MNVMFCAIFCCCCRCCCCLCCVCSVDHLNVSVNEMKRLSSECVPKERATETAHRRDFVEKVTYVQCAFNFTRYVTNVQTFVHNHNNAICEVCARLEAMAKRGVRKRPSKARKKARKFTQSNKIVIGFRVYEIGLVVVFTSMHVYHLNCVRVTEPR